MTLRVARSLCDRMLDMLFAQAARNTALTFVLSITIE